MTETISLHRLEAYDTYDMVHRTSRFRLSFDTRQHGYYQIRYLVDDDDYVLEELRDEPDLMMFTKPEQDYIECVCLIVSQLVMNGSMPDFDK